MEPRLYLFLTGSSSKSSSLSSWRRKFYSSCDMHSSELSSSPSSPLANKWLKRPTLLGGCLVPDLSCLPAPKSDGGACTFSKEEAKLAYSSVPFRPGLSEAPTKIRLLLWVKFAFCRVSLCLVCSTLSSPKKAPEAALGFEVVGERRCRLPAKLPLLI